MLNPRDRFSALVAPDRAEIPLDEASLLIAAEEYVDLDVTVYLQRLDALAEQAERCLAGAQSAAEQVDRLNGFLFRDEGFSGNRDNYYDPRNSYLNEVIDRRSGIPITLSVVYLAVASRLSLGVRGIGFPGHFLLKWTGDQEFIVDAFLGTTLSLADCQQRLDAATGSSQRLEPELHLRPAPDREILVRILSNLKQIFIQSRDWNRALDCSERVLLVQPDAAFEYRDRGLVLEQLECFYAAAADLDRFLELAPRDPSAESIRARRDALNQRLGALN